MTYSQIKQNILNYVSVNVGGVPVIWSNQNGPLPALPYITIDITSYVSDGEASQGGTDTEGNQTRSYNEDINLSIQSYGEDSEDYLQILKRSFSSEQGRLDLEAQELVLRDDGNIRNVATTIDSTMEPRYLYELILGSCEAYIEDVGVVETVEINGEINGAKTSPIIVDIEIDS